MVEWSRRGGERGRHVPIVCHAGTCVIERHSSVADFELLREYWCLRWLDVLRSINPASCGRCGIFKPHVLYIVVLGRSDLDRAPAIGIGRANTDFNVVIAFSYVMHVAAV